MRLMSGGGARMGCGQVLNCLDLYCGAGGLAFLEEGGGDEVDIVPRWAVDYNPSACFSFQANYPESQVPSTSPCPRPSPPPPPAASPLARLLMRECAEACGPDILLCGHLI